jgi:DNA-binding CsgD family transcriptional regulator
VSDAIARLVDAASCLVEEDTVLGLATQALFDACPRGLAFAVTFRGPNADRVGLLRARHEGTPIALHVPHLAHIRTPAFDLAHVPVAQRDRWVEPFREGVATPDGFRNSSIFPVIRRFGLLDMGRAVVCCGSRAVAMLGVAVPEGAPFSRDEHAALRTVAAALVVPVRVCAVLAAARGPESALEETLENTDDALFALDRLGAIVDASRAGAKLLRQKRHLPEILRTARGSRTGDGHVVHVVPIEHERASFLATVDARTLPEPPVPLSARQRELLELLDRGLGNADVAAAMGIAPSTVKTMLERLYRRTHVTNRVELLAWRRARGP